MEKSDELIDVWGIEGIKEDAIRVLSAELDAPEPCDRITAAKALLQHYRDEKKRLESKVKPAIDPKQGELFGAWDVKKPGTME